MDPLRSKDSPVIASEVFEHVQAAAGSERYSEYLRQLLTELVSINTAPSADLAPTTTSGKITQPAPISAVGDTTAEGWTRVARDRPSPTSRRTIPIRLTEPMAGRIGRPGSNPA